MSDPLLLIIVIALPVEKTLAGIVTPAEVETCFPASVPTSV